MAENNEKADLKSVFNLAFLVACLYLITFSYEKEFAKQFSIPLGWISVSPTDVFQVNSEFFEIAFPIFLCFFGIYFVAKEILKSRFLIWASFPFSFFSLHVFFKIVIWRNDFTHVTFLDWLPVIIFFGTMAFFILGRKIYTKKPFKEVLEIQYTIELNAKLPVHPFDPILETFDLQSSIFLFIAFFSYVSLVPEMAFRDAKTQTEFFTDTQDKNRIIIRRYGETTVIGTVSSIDRTKLSGEMQFADQNEISKKVFSLAKVGPFEVRDSTR